MKIYKTRKVRFKALDNISLDVYPNEFVAIVGTSGSGKSTMLNLIAGLEKPTAGKIFVKERPVHKMSEDELVDFRLKHVGFIFQNFNLLDSLTTLENVAFPLILRGVWEKESLKAAKKILNDLSLQEHLQHYPDELSGGQQQRVSIARAIITHPQIIFADEPTGNLDSCTAEQIMNILKEIVHQRSSTLLMVTHDMEKAKYADKIVRIADGVIVNVETREEQV
ncbi:MAG: ABC transporter ATP-binding protein [Eubacteriales bacterium]|nr:ABC transporter ATP-binding protein [Eubacteriales bacterium]